MKAVCVVLSAAMAIPATPIRPASAAPPIVAAALFIGEEIASFLLGKVLEFGWDVATNTSKPDCARNHIQKAAEVYASVDPKFAQQLTDLAEQLDENTSRVEYIELALQTQRELKARVDQLDEDTTRRLAEVTKRLDKIESCLDRHEQTLQEHEERIRILESQIADVQERIRPADGPRTYPRPIGPTPDTRVWSVRGLFEDYVFRPGSTQVRVRDPYTSRVRLVDIELDASPRPRWRGSFIGSTTTHLHLMQGRRTVFEITMTECGCQTTAQAIR